MDDSTDGVDLEGVLDVPSDADGVVVFAHGSGSSRHSPRNNYVAEVIRERGLGTLLFDLLTDRLVAATEWLRGEALDPTVPVSFFGSSTGAAAALRAAARFGDDAGAVVSHGGRVDMAEAALDEVRAPTLFVVGGADTQVLELNRDAYERLDCEKDFHVVADADHLG